MKACNVADNHLSILAARRWALFAAMTQLQLETERLERRLRKVFTGPKLNILTQ